MKTLLSKILFYAGDFISKRIKSERMAELYQWLMSKSLELDKGNNVWVEEISYKNTMICWCGHDLVHGGDNNYEDYGLEGDGIVSNLNCLNNNCEAEQVIVYRDFNNNKLSNK